MVRRGEFLERSVVIPHRQATLDGLFHRGRGSSAVLIAPPHPDRGSMEVPIIAELAWALARAGHPTLRFNYPGVGASPGAFSASEALDALRSAAEHLTLSAGESDGSRLIGAAVGWGAEVLAQFEAPWRAVLLVQPPVQVWSQFEHHDGPVAAFIAAGDVDDYRQAMHEAAAGRPRSRVVVIQDADEAFRAGLVQLGHDVVDALTAL
ncbi:MAG: hypothetical protein AAFN74_14765 [Myxococcota bacterium]